MIRVLSSRSRSSSWSRMRSSSANRCSAASRAAVTSRPVRSSAWTRIRAISLSACSRASAIARSSISSLVVSADCSAISSTSRRRRLGRLLGPLLGLGRGRLLGLLAGRVGGLLNALVDIGAQRLELAGEVGGARLHLALGVLAGPPLGLRLRALGLGGASLGVLDLGQRLLDGCVGGHARRRARPPAWALEALDLGLGLDELGRAGAPPPGPGRGLAASVFGASSARTRSSVSVRAASTASACRASASSRAASSCSRSQSAAADLPWSSASASRWSISEGSISSSSAAARAVLSSSRFPEPLPRPARPAAPPPRRGARLRSRGSRPRSGGPRRSRAGPRPPPSPARGPARARGSRPAPGPRPAVRRLEREPDPLRDVAVGLGPLASSACASVASKSRPRPRARRLRPRTRRVSLQSSVDLGARLGLLVGGLVGLLDRGLGRFGTVAGLVGPLAEESSRRRAIRGGNSTEDPPALSPVPSCGFRPSCEPESRHPGLDRRTVAVQDRAC